MGAVLAFTSAKGGSGTTLITAGVANSLAQREMNVLMIDCCLEASGLDLSVGADSAVVYDILDILDGNCRIVDAIVKVPGAEHLYLLPAPRTRSGSTAAAGQIVKLIGLFRQKFDFVILDVPTGQGDFAGELLNAADRVAVTVTGDRACIRSAKRRIAFLPASMDVSIIVNRVFTELVREGEFLSIDEVIRELQVPLLGAVRFDEELMIRNENGELAGDERKSSRAFRNIAGRILGEDIPVNLRGKH